MNGVGGGGVDGIAATLRRAHTRRSRFTPRSSFTGAQLCKLL